MLSSSLNQIPSGLNVQLSFSDADAAAYAQKSLREHYDEIQRQLQKQTKVSVDISDPQIEFGYDELTVSAIKK